MSIRPEQFIEFFEAVYGQEPFPWQRRLAKRVLSGSASAQWPQCLALPTGSGKTTCLDIAVFALACQADLPTSQRTAPRRIIFVVDRRVIVDEAFEHAVELAELLYEGKSPVLKGVADALRKIAGHERFTDINPMIADAVPLTCHSLRGGMYRDDAWARTPTQPCVIASTVDQIGSRILFRGYGRSNKTWPVHAGLAGNDCLIILDEAHCANPFFQTMQWISHYRSENWAETPLRSPFQFVVMSATPPRDDEGNEIADLIRDEQEDREHPVLSRRLNTSKSIKLTIANKAKGKHWQKELAIEMVKSAISLVSEERLAVGLLVNRVASAKLIDKLLGLILDSESKDFSPFDERTVKSLRKLLPENFDFFEHALMTGRMRPYDKELVADEWLTKLKANPKRKPESSPILDLKSPVFITATQCLEVGANLDFDALVSECASLDALRQRFGRLNRVGRWEKAPGMIVIREDQISSKVSDPVYGDSLSATWEWLNQIADDETMVDFGICKMNEKVQALKDERQATLIVRGPDAPVMLPAYVDCLVQTHPEPSPSPDVSLFLHGPRSGPPELRVCWRKDISIKYLDEQKFRDAVALCPPTSRECLSVPMHLFLRWLNSAADSEMNVDDLADVDISGEDDLEQLKQDGLKQILIWRGATEESRLIKSSKDLRPEDTLVIPAELGGWDEFGHFPPRSSIDVAETCHLAARRRPILRLCPPLIKDWDIPLSEKQELIQALVPENDFPDWDTIESIIEGLREFDIEALYFWEIFKKGKRVVHPLGGLVLLGPKLRHTSANSDSPRHKITIGETYTTEDDTSSEAMSSIPLEKHLDGVSKHASVFAEVTQLEPVLVRSMCLAGKLHDLGKVDARFQAMLWGGDFLRARLYGQPLAKSQGLPVTPAERNVASYRSKLPSGFRHELLSLQLIEHFPELATPPDANEVDHDLVLHLITSHHGQGRPFASVIIDDFVAGNSQTEADDYTSLQLIHESQEYFVSAAQRREWIPPHRLDSGIAERFWRLVRRYGWWGLAWLEAMFVLADHRQSELEQALTITQETLSEAKS